MTAPASPTTGSGFDLEGVVCTLHAAGVITESDVRRARLEGPRVRARLEAVRRRRPTESAYVSPLEILGELAITRPDAPGTTFSTAALAAAWARAAGVRFERIDPLELDASALCDIVSRAFARRNLVAPIALEGTRLTVAMVNPFDREATRQIEDVTGFTVEPVLGLREEILKTINEVYAFGRSLHKAQRLRGERVDLNNLEQLVDVLTEDELDASDRHIVNAVDLLLQYAFDQRASDIHIEPRRNRAVVRLRIDGRLHETHSIPAAVYPAFASRIKIMARLDIAEKRKPQDGRIKSAWRDQEIELRVSSIPVAFGEKIVIRIFDPAVLLQDIGGLGLTGEQRTVYERLIHRPHGIILVTGPTGSGKTTTLYSTLQAVASPEVNVVTIEDPIEMVHEPFNQIGVLESAGVTFAGALRSVLRQDPDIIMVGEIRDAETARYAVQAALTGHLVFSTLHTNTAVGAVARLVDLGVEPFLVASTVIGLVAQRLLRVVCPDCARPAVLDDDERFLLGLVDEDLDVSRVREGAGCETCRRTGFRGRTAAFEVIEVNERMRAMIRDRAEEDALVRAARSAGAEPLMAAAVRKLLAGETTAGEILRVIPMSG